MHQLRYVRPLTRSVGAVEKDAPNAVINSRYTPYNFVFKNLYEQFSRPLNFYFLFVAMLQFVSVIAPVSPLSTFLPLLFAFSLTAVKEGFDDVKRHRQDALYNVKRRQVLDPDTLTWVHVPNAAITVGDVVFLRRDEDVPCDVVVLAAADHKAHVFIRTDNFDGEVDLKQRDVVLVQPARAGFDPLSIADTTTELSRKLRSVELMCPAPSSVMEAFDGHATFHLNVQDATGTRDVSVPLNHVHLLPQSTVLKNTEAVIAVAVYTGDDTKCGMNKHAAPVKWAKIDKDVSYYSILIFCCQMVNAFGFGLFGYIMNRTVPQDFWYLPEPRAERGTKALFIYPLRFFLLTTVMIPVSFKFVVDMSKYYMSMTVDWDDAMSKSKLANSSDSLAGAKASATRVKNSSILEDLGQIDYVLSDKTGTMTANEMELLYVSVKPDVRVPMRTYTLPSDVGVSSELEWLACAMALCNTVEITPAAHGAVPHVAWSSVRTPVYQGASPDEVALCNGAAVLGVVLMERDDDGRILLQRQRRHVALPGVSASTDETVTEVWQLHHVFMFSSEQKTMGVIVENTATGVIHFLLKGADDRVRRALDHAEMAANVDLERHLREYAGHGLRTLLVAERQLSASELASFLEKHRQAELALEDRQARVEDLRSHMQRDMHLLGITAIEDKLQDRVASTIDDLLRAGIKVWMLTGDKVETAEQIGLSCGLYNPADEVIRIAESDLALAPGTPSTSSREGPYSPVFARGSHWRDTLLSHGSLHPAPQVHLGQPAMNADEKETLRLLGKDSARNVRYFGCQPDFAVNTRVPVTLAARTAGAEAQPRLVLVVQGGHVLDDILRTPELRDAFARVSARCVSVICARSTPSQKAAVTRFVRSLGATTLAIGDGGNDVAMLQEAHVGVGIVGKEGQQAARAADFSVDQFSDVHALVFVHGQQAYARTAYVIKYSFYKSMLISFIQLAYNTVGTYYSGGTYWNSFSLTMWNGFYTLPHTLLYCLDRCAPRVVLERTPALYKETRRSLDMRPSEFFGVFVLKGVLQSIVLLWLSNGLFGPRFADTRDGSASSHDIAFSVSYTALMISQAITVYLDSHSVTLWNAVALLGMPTFYVISTQWFSNVRTLQYFGVFARTLHVEFWLMALAEAAVLTLPFAITEAARATLWPNPRDTLRHAELQRQAQLLTHRVYHRAQSCLVRWCGATPEARSVFSPIADPAEAAALDASAMHTV